MKNTIKLFGIIVLAVVMVYSMAGCDLLSDLGIGGSGGGGSGGGGKDKDDVPTYAGEGGTFLITITGLNSSDMDSLGEYQFGCYLSNAGQGNSASLPLAAFYSGQHDYNNGGTGNNCWISFYLYSITPLSATSYTMNQNHYSAAQKNYDIQITLSRSLPYYSSLFSIHKSNVFLVTNQENVFPFASFY